jgi:hypothetical protein
MREIKFRAWNESLKKYSKPFGLGDNVLNYTNEEGLGTIKSLTNEIVDQYTGLKDKNGKEIYEGDVLKEEDRLFTVVWDDVWAKFKLKHEDKYIQYPDWNRGVKMEIVGNIHE